MKHNQKKINIFFFAIFALFLILGAAVPAAAETSIVWSQEIGNVAAADMSEDGQTIYAAVGSQIFVYDSAGVQQNVFTVGGNVVKLVCTDDGTRAALYTDGNEVYYIDSGALTWTQSFTAITDIDISNAGSVLVVESGVFHKYLKDGTLEYNSSSGTYNLGVIDPDDEFAIVQSGNTDLKKYLLTTTDQYWAKVGDNTFNTNFSDFQNLLILESEISNPVILNTTTINNQVFLNVYDSSCLAVTTPELITTNSDNYQITTGQKWFNQSTSQTWSPRYAAYTWVFNNKMWIAGGRTQNVGLNDVWFSDDGVSWTQATASAAWTAGIGAASWVFNNEMWLSTSSGSIWHSSDGVSWTQATASAGWTARTSAASWVFNDKMWIAGGASGSTRYGDVWFSDDGVSWTRATASAGWTARTSAASWVFNDKMWIAGGTHAPGNALRDVWYSDDGVSWTQATASAAWAYRAGACAMVFDNKMWIAAGTQTTATTPPVLHDLWYSDDGVSWTQATASAGWTARADAASWVFKDKMWIAGGTQSYSSTATALNDIWDSEQGIIIQLSNPTTYVFYNYTGVSPQHTQTTYTGAVPFTGTTELQTKPTLSIYDLQTTKTLNGNIQAISLSDRGDWLGTATTTRIYHDQITSGGFGTEYYAALGSTGTIYDIATANSAAMSVVGQGQITDIYSMSASRVGTYTAGGAVTHVDIADKNALWASSGGEDGKAYIFSKDASSNWYLEYSSDSEDPITALKMSSRGEFVLAGRTSSLTLYQTNTPEQADTNFWFTLYIYKDSDSYRQAAVNVSVYNINNQWQSFAEGLTDSSGKFVLQLTAGNTYKFDVANGQKVLVYQAAPSVPSQVVSIHTSPVSAALTYEAEWDPEIGGVTFDYMDSTGQTQTVIVKIIRTDTWETVYEQTYTGQQSIEQSVPIVDDTVGYKVELSASRSSGITRNTWFVSSSRDIVPIPLDTNIKNILFSCFLIFLAGLFSYLSAFRGAIVVCLSAIFFTYMGWLTIPWHWLVVAVVLAFVAGFTQRRT